MASKRVLVVDDDSDALTISGALLMRAGYAVAKIGVGTQACATATEYAPDVILLDYRFPDITGAAIASELAADPLCAGIPVVILTADAGALTLEFSPNVRRVFLKPCAARVLLNAIAEVADGEFPPH